MKPVIVLIFNLAFPALLPAECKPLAQTTGAETFWKLFSEEYGPVRFPSELSVCTGRNYLFEIKGGAKMQSALDRKKGRILRRESKLTLLMHEMAHVYLDMRWRVLPYPVAEPFVLAISDPAQCPAPADARKTTPLRERWKTRATLARCDLVRLLKDVFNADAELRNALPLN